MEFKATVSYGSGKAWYRISKEKPGIYCASLLTFDVKNEPSPPVEITLIRGVRNWAGSDSNVILINDLGQLIEAHLTTPFKKHSAG